MTSKEAKKIAANGRTARIRRAASALASALECAENPTPGAAWGPNYDATSKDLLAVLRELMASADELTIRRAEKRYTKAIRRCRYFSAMADVGSFHPWHQRMVLELDAAWFERRKASKELDSI